MAMSEKEKKEVVEQLLEEIQRMYYIDEGTNLLNKRYLNKNKNRIALEALKDLTAEKRKGTPKLVWSLLSCDINDLHTLNNTIGKHQVDIGIKAIADILSSCLRGNNDYPDKILISDVSDFSKKEDKAIRTDGDEFIVLLPNCTKEEALLVKKRINKKIAENIETASRGMSLSIGIADTTEIELPEKIENRDTVIKFFDDLEELATARMKLEKYGDIEKALGKEVGRICSNMGLNLSKPENLQFLIDALNKYYGKTKEAEKTKS